MGQLETFLPNCPKGTIKSTAFILFLPPYIACVCPTCVTSPNVHIETLMVKSKPQSKRQGILKNKTKQSNTAISVDYKLLGGRPFSFYIVPLRFCAMSDSKHPLHFKHPANPTKWVKNTREKEEYQLFGAYLRMNSSKWSSFSLLSAANSSCSASHQIIREVD